MKRGRWNGPAAGLAIGLALAGCRPAATDEASFKSWAYPKAAEAPLPSPPPGPQHVPGSRLTLSLAQATDDSNPPDWNPEEHPPAPTIVAHGTPAVPTPCGACHLINGQGFIGAPNLAGLPAAYIIDQVHAFRDGRRRSSEPGRPATAEMIAEARRVDDRRLAMAAAYFAGLRRAPWTRVVETDTAPVTRPNHYGWLDRAQGGQEPIGGRIIELPTDYGRMLLSDPHVGLVDYVPPGAVARGRDLARSGGPAGLACASCHGADLRGAGAAPPLAGRSAAYLARMIWDIRTGARADPGAAPMKAVAAGLDPAQITDLTAYLASLRP